MSGGVNYQLVQFLGGRSLPVLVSKLRSFAMACGMSYGIM